MILPILFVIATTISGESSQKLKTELLKSLNHFSNNEGEQLEILSASPHSLPAKDNSVSSPIGQIKIFKRTKHSHEDQSNRIKLKQLARFDSIPELHKIRDLRQNFYQNYKSNSDFFKPHYSLNQDPLRSPIIKEFGKDTNGRTIRLFGVESSGYRFNQSSLPLTPVQNYLSPQYPTLSPIAGDKVYEDNYGNSYLSPMTSNNNYDPTPIVREKAVYDNQRPSYSQQAHYNSIPSNTYSSYTTPTPQLFQPQTIPPYTITQPPYINYYTTEAPKLNYYEPQVYSQVENKVYNSACPSGTKPSYSTPGACERILEETPSYVPQEIGVPEVTAEDINGARHTESIEKCNSPRLQKLIEESIITNNADKSKRAVQDRLEQEFGVYFNVICGTGFFSYIAHTDEFCQISGGNVNCYAFAPACSPPPNAQRMQQSMSSYPGMFPTKNKRSHRKILLNFN
uniref:Ground-like domain-containing protein n=1 Tax=Rhabditophanes sp. KR3021 TaxID=114890 RepID=A0AC35UIQ9_9BILA